MTEVVAQLGSPDAPGTVVATSKRKVSLSLDADLVAALESDGSLSAQVNELLRVEVERRRHREALRDLIDNLVDVHGPLDTPEDLEAIERYTDLLS